MLNVYLYSILKVYVIWENFMLYLCVANFRWNCMLYEFYMWIYFNSLSKMSCFFIILVSSK